MLSAIVSTYIILVELIFGVLAIFTQRAALSSKNQYSIIVHGLAWSVEVLVSVSSFFILSLFSTVGFATLSFIIGFILLIVGILYLYMHVNS